MASSFAVKITIDELNCKSVPSVLGEVKTTGPAVTENTAGKVTSLIILTQPKQPIRMAALF